MRGGVDPRAKPLTIVTPRAARSPASRAATSRPYGVGPAGADDGDRQRVVVIDGAAYPERRPG